MNVTADILRGLNLTSFLLQNNSLVAVFSPVAFLMLASRPLVVELASERLRFFDPA